MDEARRRIETEATGEFSCFAPFDEPVIDALRTHAIEGDFQCVEFKVLAECRPADRVIVIGRAVRTQDVAGLAGDSIP